MLFPAHAGVIPKCAPLQCGFTSFPRTRGGDPYISVLLSQSERFSPHTRG